MIAVGWRNTVARLPKAVSIVLFWLVALGAFAQTAPQNRIAQAIDNAQFVTLRGSGHPLAKLAFDRGPVDGNMQLHGVSMVFKPSPAQQQALNTLLAEQQDRNSPNYHKWLTRVQYADRFGLTQADIAKASAWLVSQGFTIDRVSGGRTSISFSGTAAQMESAFHSEIHQYQGGGEEHFANAGAISVPTALASVVLNIRGLDNFRPKSRHTAVRQVTASPRFTNGSDHFVAPEDFATIYDVQKLYNIGIDGTGQTIAVMGQTAIKMSDITSFRSAAGLSANEPTIIIVPGTGTPVVTSADDLGEADLDLEWSGAVAKNASILFVIVGPNSNNGVFDSLAYALDPSTTQVPAPPLAPVISISYGGCEAQEVPLLFAQELQQDIQAGNAQGTTVTAAAGDSGAADCDVGATATQGLAVDVPAAIPEVTGMGGSEFLADVSNPIAYWSSVTDANGGSALMYIPEEAWNDTALQGALDAGGGGVSTFFLKPTWQTGAGFLSSGRNVPDISLNASNWHDSYLFCSTPTGTATACTDGFVSANSELYLVGGTSAGAPTFAGILALINQATNSTTGQGNVNPTLYALAASTPSAFNDITSGSNLVPCATGSPSCPTSGAHPGEIGYSAGTGYDQATGLGSVDAYNLVTNWPGFSTTATYTVGGTTVTISSPGNPGTSTITVDALNGFNGTVDLSCTPPSSTTALITCSIPASVTVNGSSTTASLMINTTAPHAVLGTSSAMNHSKGLGWFAASSGGLLAGVLVMGVPSRRRKYTAMFGMVLFGFMITGVGCGGGSSSSTTIPGTPAGNYTVTVTAVSGSITRTASVSVTVQ
jgi:subtilase family serine protease